MTTRSTASATPERLVRGKPLEDHGQANHDDWLGLVIE